MTTTHTPASACPEPEVIGAFVEGRLGAWKRWKMTRHLDRCETCRDDVAALADFAAAPAAANVVQFPTAPARRWWTAAAASLVTILGAATIQQVVTARRNQSPVAPLAAASARLGSRSVEARLSGFPWAELRTPNRSSTEDSNPRRQQLVGEAGKVRERAEANPDDSRLQHAAAIASLLVDEPRAAIESLAKLTQEHPDDARAWSDLAAARHTAATRFDVASEDSLALAAADRALKLDPDLAEARFNRALILERLGLLADARAAWDQYLAIDATSGWAREAHERRDAISMRSPRAEFLKELPQLEQSAAAGDASFVARFPEESRLYAENRTLGQWAAAVAKGDAAQAQRQLAIARAIGSELRTRSGERLLADLVAEIERGDRARPAAAHAAFAQGYAAQKRADHAAARDGYLRAAALFGDTPSATWARCHAAEMANHAGEVETALREFDELSTRISDHHKALFALVEHARGLALARLTRWSDAIPHYQVALALFNGLGERTNAAFTSALIGETASFLGRRDDAWKAWSDALRAFSETGDREDVPRWLNVAANSENLAGHPEAAISLFDLAMQQHNPTAALRSEILLRRARLSASAGDGADAARFMALGKQEANEIKDEIPRENALADLDVAEGIVYASSDPRRALVSLNRAVGLRQESRRMLLPATLFERANVLRALDRADEAMADLVSAIDAVESQRSSVQWRDTKSGALDGVDDIYTSLAELLLERGKTREAFTTADRAAAHAFYGAAATGSIASLDELQQRLAPGEVVLEYLVLPRKTIVFVVGPGMFDVRETAVASGEVARRFDALDKALRERAPFEAVQRASSALHSILIAPVRDHLRAGGAITFVPDPLLASVPFAALFDDARDRWLIEDHALRVVPSALYRDQSRPEKSSRVVVIRPATQDVDLPRTKSEAAMVTALYPQATVMEGDAATVASVLGAIRDADVVHYAGHTNSDTEAGLLLRAENIVYGADIARTPLRAAPLVVLAGCRTLRGGSRREDLATSLARAFLLAGARSVVGTAWDVDDEPASAFFTQFHQSLAANGDSVAALCGAQRSLLQHRRRHPSDWAFAQIVVRAL